MPRKIPDQPCRCGHSRQRHGELYGTGECWIRGCKCAHFERAETMRIDHGQSYPQTMPTLKLVARHIAQLIERDPANADRIRALLPAPIAEAKPTTTRKRTIAKADPKLTATTTES